MDSLALRQDVRRGCPGESEARQPSVLDEVFDHLPHGIAVTDRVGRVITWNPALEDVLELEGEPLGSTCCELFGCGTARGPRGGCLTEQAIRGGRPLEVVIPRTGGTPLWTTVAPLREDGSRLVFEVRHAPERGALKPASSHITGEPRVRLFTLGRTEVLTPEGSLNGEWLDQQPGQLLKYLACERHRVVPAEEIAEAICRHARSTTVNTVRYFIHALRKKLEPGRPKGGRPSVVLARHGGYTLNDSEVWLDADEFEASVDAGLAAIAHGESAVAADHFKDAVSLYEGDFFADEPYAEWALLERERLRALVEKPLRALSELHTDDDPDAAAGYLERLAHMEPLDGTVQRELLSLWVRQGRLSRAARHYHAFEQRLFRQFGERPAFRLSELVPDA